MKILLVVLPLVGLAFSETIVRKEMLNFSLPFVKIHDYFCSYSLLGTSIIYGNGQINIHVPDFETLSTPTVIKKKLKGIETSTQGEKKLRVPVFIIKGSEREKWLHHKNNYEDILIRSKDVEILVKAYTDRLQKTIIINPGTDISSLKIELQGQNQLRINEKGELVLRTNNMEIKLTKPKAYQLLGDDRKIINVNYAIHEKGYGFQINNEYDKSLPLFITFYMKNPLIGKAFAEENIKAVTNMEGFSYLSTSLPSCLEEMQVSDYDIVIYGFDPGFKNLIGISSVGGVRNEHLSHITVDSHDNILISGNTNSPDIPATYGGYEGDKDGFIIKFDNDLSEFKSIVMGGRGKDTVSYMITDPFANIYVVGTTYSSQFLNTEGATDGDIFVIKFSSNLEDIERLSRIGGSKEDIACCIAIDFKGNIYISGTTYSPDFPITEQSFDPTHNGSADIFVLKFKKDTSEILSSTFAGGKGDDTSKRLVLDSLGNVYIIGNTLSPDFIPANENIKKGLILVIFNSELDKIIAINTVNIK